MKVFNENNKEQFIHNQEFTSWVLNPTEESDLFWDNFIANNPSHKKGIDQSRLFIKSLVRNNKELSDDEVSTLWDKINKTRNSSKRLSINLKRLSIAAGILMILGLSGWWLSVTNNKKDEGATYQSIASNKNQGNEIKLIMSDQTEKTFTTKEVDLKYNQQGQLETRSGKHTETEELENDSNTLQMNQLVVPRGKRSSIELADGTKLWLNSGSRAIYPVVFKGKTREIFIEGEGYLEVAHDVAHPFFVVTDQIKIEVLGTKFDISAYKEDDCISVVLVEGSVQASIGHDNRIMEPNQILNYQKLTQKTSLEKTNVLEYIAWKDGYMLCNNEQVKTITTKLSRYYDIDINYEDTSLSNMTITGKLDLKSNCEDVLKVICATAPLEYKIVDNEVFMKKNEY
ncbi:MAG: FecR domain-containing protein [Mariniphaga sp.]